jgi:HPt (histidine-containing phosphotransfer) domain-containing protein
MDAFVSKPITPEKLAAVLADRDGSGQLTEASGADYSKPDAAGIRLDLLRHLSDSSPGAVGRQLAAFCASLDEAMRGVASARASSSRPAVSSAAHRVLSLARMVGAAPLAATAADLQDYASAYTDTELDEEIGTLLRHAGDLGSDLLRLAEDAELNRSSAS